MEFSKTINLPKTNFSMKANLSVTENNWLKFWEEKKTISIEVGMQNSGLGMALSILHFSKIVALPSAIFSLWHNISAVGLVYCWKKK